MANPALPISSPDISSLSYKVLFDISGALPTIVLTNLSTVIHANNLTWWYVTTTPAGIPIHSGSATSPDVSGTAWTTLQIPTYAWTTPFGNPPCGQVEFSADVPYICTLYVKDSANNTYSLTIQQTVTRPNGNTQNSCGNFGRAVVNIEVKCNENPAMVYCNANTNMAYNNQVIPDVQTNEWILTYPPDAIGNDPANRTASNTPSVKFPISYSGDGYVLFFNNFCTYDMGNGASIKLQYKAINPKTGSGGLSFAVLCNVNLCKLSCQIQTFYQLSKKSCGDLVNQSLNAKMTQMNLLLNQAIIGVFYPACGIDVPAIIKQIQLIGDLDENCDCGCGDTGVNFSYPISANPGGGSGGGCCPVSSSVIDINTDEAPALCPNSYFPVNVYDPTGVTQIGVAYEINGLVAILNAYPAWAAYGTAFAQGNCKVGWFPTNSGVTIPDIKVEIITDVTGGGGNNGTGGGQGGGIFQNFIWLEGTLAAPPPCPASFYPASVYNYDDTAIIGVANSVLELVALLNSDPTWSVFGNWIAPANCFVNVTLADPNNIPVKRVFVSPIPVDGVNTVNKKIVDIGTTSPPTQCPASFYPAKVYNPAGTAVLGIANNINDICSILNANSLWNAYGTAAPLDNCNVKWTLITAGNIPPDVPVDTNVGGTTCVNGAQTYQITVADLCTTGGPVTLSSYPLNLYVDFSLGAGKQFVGNVASQAAAVTALNALSTKPAAVTFSSGATVDKVIATNTNCTAYSSVIVLSTDAGSSNFLLHGANHSNLNGATPTSNGYYAATLKNNTLIGRLAGAVDADFRFHVIKLPNGNTVHVESNTGKVYFYSNTNPNMPSLYATVQLNTVDANNFTGLPLSSYRFGSTPTSSFYSLYMPTDYISPSSTPGVIYIFESTTGTGWAITASGVVHSFKDQRLLGKCPRVLINDTLYFTQDGDMETYTGASGLLPGQIVYLDVNNFNAGGLTIKTIITNQLDEIWSAAYDGSGSIYFSGRYTSIVKYNPMGNFIVSTNMYVLPGSGPGGLEYHNRLNTIYFMGELYNTPSHVYVHFMPIINVSTLAIRDVTATPKYSSATALYNFLPLGNCLGILTYNGSSPSSPPVGPRGAMAIYKTDGTYICDIDLGGDVDIYNVVEFPNQPTYLPTAFNF